MSNLKPCKNGVIFERKHGHCRCPACKKQKSDATNLYIKNRKATDQQFKEQIRANSREWARRKSTDPDYKLSVSLGRKLRRKADPRIDMLTSARERANKSGVPFDLSKEDIVVPETCPVLGITLEVNENRVADSSPTLDRFIPELGYTKGNVAVISYRANRIKTDASVNELRALVNWMDACAKEIV